jgi:hypothetical protein
MKSSGSNCLFDAELRGQTLNNSNKLNVTPSSTHLYYNAQHDFIFFKLLYLHNGKHCKYLSYTIISKKKHVM